MKLAPFFLVLILQVNASFFDVFQNTMSSLQNGFQKFITDVVTDVKDTIDCTVIAVESALSFGVIANNLQNAKCKGASDEFIIIDRSKSDDNIGRLSLDFLRDKPFEDTHERSSLDEDVSTQIDVSISNIHAALYDIVNKKDVKSGRIENGNNIKSDNDRLNNVNVFLKHELANMSSSIKDEIRRVNLNNESASDFATKFINILHNKEQNSKSSDITEVRRILAGVSKILSANVKNNVSDDDKIIDILTNLERRSNKEKITNMQSHISKWEVNNFSDDSIKPDFYPKTFKDLFDKKLPVTTSADNVNKNQNTEEKEISTENKSNSFTNTINDDYDSLYSDTLPLDKGEYHKETLEQAKNLIKDSLHTDSILNSFFAEVDQSGDNIFDNF